MIRYFKATLYTTLLIKVQARFSFSIFIQWLLSFRDTKLTILFIASSRAPCRKFRDVLKVILKPMELCDVNFERLIFLLFYHRFVSVYSYVVVTCRTKQFQNFLLVGPVWWYRLNFLQFECVEQIHYC